MAKTTVHKSPFQAEKKLASAFNKGDVLLSDTGEVYVRTGQHLVGLHDDFVGVLELGDSTDLYSLAPTGTFVTIIAE